MRKGKRRGKYLVVMKREKKENWVDRVFHTEPTIFFPPRLIRGEKMRENGIEKKKKTKPPHFFYFTTFNNKGIILIYSLFFHSFF